MMSNGGGGEMCPGGGSRSGDCCLGGDECTAAGGGISKAGDSMRTCEASEMSNVGDGVSCRWMGISKEGGGISTSGDSGGTGKSCGGVDCMYSGTTSGSDCTGLLTCTAATPSGEGLRRLGSGGDAFCGGVISEHGDGDDDSSCMIGGGDTLPREIGLSCLMGGGSSCMGEGLSCLCGDCGGEMSSLSDGIRRGGDCVCGGGENCRMKDSGLSAFGTGDSGGVGVLIFCTFGGDGDLAVKSNTGDDALSGGD